MIDIEATSLPLLVTLFVGFLTIMISAIMLAMKLKNLSSTNEEHDTIMEEIPESVILTIKDAQKNKNARKNDQWKKGKESSFNHPWLVSSLKGHSSKVVDVDFASDGKKFVSISDDRMIILWDVRDFEEKEHKCIRQTLDYDTPTHVSFAPDCKSVILSVKRDNKLCVYKLAKKNNQSYNFQHIDALDFENSHQADICSIGISSNAKYLMSCSSDNKIVLYDLKGYILKNIDAKVSSLYDCRLSPDGKFIIVSGFTPDVFVFEPIFNRDGTFQDVKKVFNLCGHRSGVLSAAFNSNSTRAVTVSRDGSWRIFNIDIRYEAGQDAPILKEGIWDVLIGASTDNVRLAVSPTADSFAISYNNDVRVFSSEDGEMRFPKLEGLHSSPITSIRYSPDGKYIATCGDKVIRILRNVPEWYSQVVKLERNLLEISHDGTRRRVQEQIEEAKFNLQYYSE